MLVWLGELVAVVCEAELLYTLISYLPPALLLDTATEQWPVQALGLLLW